jgi:hypothetical protein
VRIIVAKDYETMSKQAAIVLAGQIIHKPNSVLGRGHPARPRSGSDITGTGDRRVWGRPKLGLRKTNYGV